MKARHFLTALALLIAASVPWTPARAADREAQVIACLQSAATAFHLDVLPLVVLRQVEGGAIGMASPNTDGSFDLGPMQINTSWLPRLRRLGITAAMVRDDPCVNAYVGAWIFYEEWKGSGNVAMAMARYHSPTAKHQLHYLQLVSRVIERNLAKLPPAALALASTP